MTRPAQRTAPAPDRHTAESFACIAAALVIASLPLAGWRVGLWTAAAVAMVLAVVAAVGEARSGRTHPIPIEQEGRDVAS